MLDWFDLSTMLSSVLGSFIAGLLLLTAMPVWWKWLKPGDTTKLRKTIGAIFFCAVVLGLLILSGYLGRNSIPLHHPTLSDKEAASAFFECEMKSIDITSAIQRRSSREAAKRRYRSACLIGKGFEWNPRRDTE